MKKLILVLLLIAGAAQGAVLSTNLSVGGVHLLSTSRKSVYSIELSSTYANMVEMFDCDSKAAPYYGTNYTSSAYVYRLSYPTSIVDTYVGNNGYTNWYTNSYIWTANLTNAAATNALTPLVSHALGAGTYGIYNEDALFTKGLTIRCTTNVNVVINYRPAQ